MRKTIFLCLFTAVLSIAFSQGRCADDVIENLEVDINFGQMEVDLSWDFNDPVICIGPLCPPYLVFYEIQVEFGYKHFGPSGPTNWFQSNVYGHSQVNIHLIHSYTVPIASKFEYVRFRVKDDRCTDWEDWVTTSVWD